MQDQSTSLVIDRVERYLNTARLAIENGDPESAASRAYYALYHMTKLLLKIPKGIERDRWDHDQLQKAFLDEFCKLHFSFSRADGREWGYLMDTRFTADYDRDPLNRRRALMSLERADRLIAKMRREVGGDA